MKETICLTKVYEEKLLENKKSIAIVGKFHFELLFL